MNGKEKPHLDNTKQGDEFDKMIDEWVKANAEMCNLAAESLIFIWNQVQARIGVVNPLTKPFVQKTQNSIIKAAAFIDPQFSGDFEAALDLICEIFPLGGKPKVLPVEIKKMAKTIFNDKNLLTAEDIYVIAKTAVPESIISPIAAEKLIDFHFNNKPPPDGCVH